MNDIIKHDNIFYVRNIHAIGGVETYVYEMAKKYQDKDIAVVCKTVAPEQKRRLEKYCRVYIHKNQPIECKIIITNWDTSIIEYVNKEAKFYTVLHTDYSNSEEAKGLPKDYDRITYIGITEDSKKKFEDLTGIKRTILCRNPLELDLDKDEPVLVLASATRLSEIKGGKRMLMIANELDRQGINFIWLLFTTYEYQDNPVWQNKNVIHMGNRLDIGHYLKMADWIVQPSICEGDSYTLKEALYRGTPVVVCELGYFKEYGIKDGVNALFLKEDGSNVEDVVRKMKKPLKFEFEKVKDGYDEIIIDGKSKYKEELKMKVKVKALINFNDLDEDAKRVAGDEFECSKIRAEYLVEHKAVEILEEIKPKKEVVEEQVEVLKETKKRKSKKEEE